MKRFIMSVLAIVFCFSMSTAEEKKAEAIASSKMTGFRAEFFMQLDDIQKKIEDLADAMPAESYSWRPMEGVRSVSEVYMHITGANYLFPTFIGIKSPDSSKSDEGKKITEKSKVIEELKKSFSHLRSAIEGVADANLDKPAKFFGQETTVRGVIFEAMSHLHEHLGQSIAYARMNKIVPPWTAAEQAKEKKDTKK